jgi:uncharacterized repeat protein (TIGR04076 family)
MAYKLTGKIIDIKGTCHAGHIIGEEIDLTLFEKNKHPKGLKLCPYFMGSIFPYICTMQYGGQFPWGKDPNSVVFVCPDFEAGVKIRIDRTSVEEKK